MSLASVFRIALWYDEKIIQLVCRLFRIHAGVDFDNDTHGIGFEFVERQMKIAIRLGGLGLRNSGRIAPAAYWGSWADCISVLLDRFPLLVSTHFNSLNNDAPQILGIECLDSLQKTRIDLRDVGWNDIPTWNSLIAGERPPVPDPDNLCLGEWQHGWQYHGTYFLEQNEFNLLLKNNCSWY